MKFEKNLKELEAIVDKMSEDKISLTEAIQSFKKGMEIVKQCQAELNQAEQTVQKLVKIHSDGQIETADFKAND